MSRKTPFELRAALDDLSLRQADLARMCGVERGQVWRWTSGRADIPEYVWCILSLAAGAAIWEVWKKEWRSWVPSRNHVYRPGETYKILAKRWHPDTTGRDTNAEMALINAFRPRS